MKLLTRISLVVTLLIAGLGVTTVHAQNTATQQFTLTVAASPLAISNTSLSSGTTGKAYSNTLTATGGVSPFTFTVSVGTLPTGLTLTSGGVLSGTPTTAGSKTFTVKVTDSVGSTATTSFAVTISAPLVISATALPGANINQPYSATINVSGGVPPYTAALSTGALPTGLTLSVVGSTVNITGTPTVAGPSTFTVQVTDSATP